MTHEHFEPRVSVLLPVRNAEASLERALQSILRQEFRNWELICIDDASCDQSARILQRFAQADRRVRVYSFPEHQGLVAALNAAISLARAPLLARMDADDVSLPRRLLLQVEALEESRVPALVSSLVSYGGNRDTQTGYALHVDWCNQQLSESEISLARFVDSPLPHPSVCFHRELCDTYGAYREGSFPEDYELWLRWLENGVPMRKLPEVLLEWKDPPARLSRVDSRYNSEAFDRVRIPYLASWLQKHNPAHPDVILWGAGRMSRLRARKLLDHGIRFRAHVDIDPGRIGQSIAGCPVWAPEQLPPPSVQVFVLNFVGSRGARELIQARLLAAGYRLGVHFLHCA